MHLIHNLAKIQTLGNVRPKDRPEVVLRVLLQEYGRYIALPRNNSRDNSTLMLLLILDTARDCSPLWSLTYRPCGTWDVISAVSCGTLQCLVTPVHNLLTLIVLCHSTPGPIFLKEYPSSTRVSLKADNTVLMSAQPAHSGLLVSYPRTCMTAPVLCKEHWRP